MAESLEDSWVMMSAEDDLDGYAMPVNATETNGTTNTGQVPISNPDKDPQSTETSRPTTELFTLEDLFEPPPSFFTKLPLPLSAQ
jgi:hypothetical protein